MNKCSIKKERNVTGSRLVRGFREKGENIKRQVTKTSYPPLPLPYTATVS